jgi:hypothetical protein
LQEEEEYKIVCEKKWNSTAPATIVRIQEQKPPTTTRSALVVVSPHVSTQGSLLELPFFESPSSNQRISYTAVLQPFEKWMSNKLQFGIRSSNSLI